MDRLELWPGINAKVPSHQNCGPCPELISQNLYPGDQGLSRCRFSKIPSKKQQLRFDSILHFFIKKQHNLCIYCFSMKIIQKLIFVLVLIRNNNKILKKQQQMLKTLIKIEQKNKTLKVPISNENYQF